MKTISRVGIKFTLISIAILLVAGCNNQNKNADLKPNNNVNEPTSVEQAKNEDLSNNDEKGALKTAEKYWDATKFKDYGDRYQYICSDVKTKVSKETYIAKYKEDEDERPMAKVNNYELGDIRIEGNKAYIRTMLYTLFYDEEPDNSMTEMMYEDGQWCKILSDSTVEWLME